MAENGRRAALLEDLRGRVARIERRPLPPGRAAAAAAAATIPFGVPEIDRALPTGGIARGALHEAAGAGLDAEHGAAAALLAAGVLARAGAGPVLWVSERFDLFAPALAGAGLGPGRVLHVEAGGDVLLAMEEGLRHPGLTGVVGEVTGRLGLTASRRLQLAAGASGAVAFALRRPRRRGADAAAALLAEPTAAATRWRVAPLPSAPPLPHAPDTPGLGRARWRLDLVRCRGGEPRSWIVEACDAQGGVRLVADLGHGRAAPPLPRPRGHDRRAAAAG